jgi:hypothetical protein
MYDTGKVFAGLLIFALLFTSPILYNLAVGEDVADPDLGPARAKSEYCVEETGWMRANHMDLLNDWRDSVVREGNRVYTARDGKEYNMSLTNTCMNCHSNYLNFCNRCHSYNGVVPSCWDCHVNFSEEFK